MTKTHSYENKINWNFSDPNLRSIFYSILSSRLVFNFNHPAFTCDKCTHVEHLSYLEKQWEYFIFNIQTVGKEVFGIVNPKKNCIPGWNSYVKDFYTTSREAFKMWKECGSPRTGPIACTMRTARANFKYALRQCRREEESMRAEALSMKLQNDNVNDSCNGLIAND